MSKPYVITPTTHRILRRHFIQEHEPLPIVQSGCIHCCSQFTDWTVWQTCVDRNRPSPVQNQSHVQENTPARGRTCRGTSISLSFPQPMLVLILLLLELLVVHGKPTDHGTLPAPMLICKLWLMNLSSESVHRHAQWRPRICWCYTAIWFSERFDSSAETFMDWH